MLSPLSVTMYFENNALLSLVDSANVILTVVLSTEVASMAEGFAGFSVGLSGSLELSLHDTKISDANAKSAKNILSFRNMTFSMLLIKHKTIK
jgi:hypothetical protein